MYWYQALMVLFRFITTVTGLVVPVASPVQPLN